MTPERMAGLVARWVRLYTRSLPAPVARRRVDEIDADLHDHICHERTQGTSDRRIALSIASRMARGLPADTAWRSHHATAHSPTRHGAMTRTTASRSALRVVLGAALILLLPLVAMLVTDEMNWGPIDFALAGVLLVGAGAIVELAVSRAGTPAYKAAAGVALGAALLLVWAYLAVGILGETGDRADLMYGAVLAVGLLGAVLARFRPHGMARALLATALAQAVVAGIALLAGKHEAAVSSVTEILGVNGLFVALFAASAWLFQQAAGAGSGGREAEA
jgi:GNAT superfamily N-acetyltransferase